MDNERDIIGLSDIPLGWEPVHVTGDEAEARRVCARMAGKSKAVISRDGHEYTVWIETISDWPRRKKPSPTNN